MLSLCKKFGIGLNHAVFRNPDFTWVRIADKIPSGASGLEFWRNFLVLKSRCHGFSVLEYWCRDFLSSEKMSWYHNVVVYLSVSPCHGVLVVEFGCCGFLGFFFSMSWLFSLRIPMLWYMCLHDLVFVFTKSIMPYK